MAIYTGAKWGASSTMGSSGGVVTWSFANSVGVLTQFADTIAEAPFRTAIRSAFATWERVANIDFTEVTDSYSSNIRLGWATMDGAYGVLGMATWQMRNASLVRAEIAFDEAESWKTTASNGAMDFLSVALHEIGHAIGLGHVDAPTSIMYAYAQPVAQLSQDDVRAVQQLYGAPAVPVSVVPAGFDPLEYIASYADLSGGFGANAEAGLHHFVNHGRTEGRTVTFDALEYIASYADLSRGFGANADAGSHHFIVHGRTEGRKSTFDALEYIASYADLSRGFGANADAGSRHFIAHGRTEGRKTSFDALEYIASHADLLKGLGLNPDAGSRHFIMHGRAEGRSADRFDAEQYLENYADLKNSFGNNHEAATKHYIRYGFWEGRTDELVFPDDGWLLA